MHLRSLFLLTTLSLLAGCKTVHVLGPDQLAKLDGYDVASRTQPPPRLVTKSGEVVTFGPRDALHFVTWSGVTESGRIFKARTPPDAFVATLAGGRSLLVELPAVQEVRLVTPSVAKTALLIISSVLVGGALAVGAGWLVVSNLRLSLGPFS